MHISRFAAALLCAALIVPIRLVAHAQQNDPARLDSTAGAPGFDRSGFDRGGLDTSGLSVPRREAPFGQHQAVRQASAQVVAQAPGQVPMPAAPTPPAQTTAPGGAATLTQHISVQAGTGVLLRLPQPAATVMSAEPSIARVQPASPTSLFLMGVDTGDTTVVALNASGTAIVQYNVTSPRARKRARPRPRPQQRPAAPASAQPRPSPFNPR